MSIDSRQGTFELGDDAPPPSLLEDPDVELGDLATVAYVERPTTVHRHYGPNGRVIEHSHNHGAVSHSHGEHQPAHAWRWGKTS